MTLFVKHFNIYLPTGCEVSKYPVHLPLTSDAITLPSSRVYAVTLFTVEHKKVRIRHNLLYVKM